MKRLKRITAVLAAVIMVVAALPSGLLSAAAPDHIVINQIYGGGGKGDTPFSHSFIELYNPTDSVISLVGYKITYSSNRENSKGKHAGSTWVSDGSAEEVELALNGSIPAKTSYLIRCAAEDTSVAAVTLDKADIDWERVIDNDQSVEIILYNGEVKIDAVSTRTTDFRDVGEGAAPATEDISKQKSLRRTNFADTDNNAADFTLLVWNSLPADEAQKQAFIDENRPRSLVDGEWGNNQPGGDGESQEPQEPEQSVTLKTDGFENANALALQKLGSYVTGVSNKDGGVAEIVAFDTKNNAAWVVNGATGYLDIVSLADITCAVSEEMTAKQLDIKELVKDAAPDFTYGDMTSVAVSSELGIAAVALQDAAYDKNGYAAILTTDGDLLAMIPVGNQPDMITFTPDGTKILTADEGEPRGGIGDGITDPAGSVTVITLNTENVKESTAVTVGFEAFDSRRAELLANGVILRKNAAPSVDLEPEYIACTDDTAYVSLQEANAIAVLDLNTNTFKGVYSLGFKDLSLEENAVDLSEDNAYAPKTYTNAVGAYMPDGIAVYTVNGQTYILTANEGDAREWGSGAAEYVNEKKVTLTATDGTQAKKVRVIDSSVTDGLPEGKNVLFGGRSFSVYKADENGITQVYDSANDFEARTAEYLPEYFNCSNDDNDFDSRSLKKGPEPESVTVGTVDGKAYAFTALERVGGIMVYDVTDPSSITYVNYINTRDFSENPENASPDNADTALKSDIAPEGLCFISAEQSPSKTPILLAAFEVSGTVAAYSVGEAPTGHIYGSNWSYDSEGHWQVCEACGESTQKTAHTFENGVCTVCSAVEKSEQVISEQNEADKPAENTVEKESGEALPQTSDSSDVLMWAVIMCAAAGAFAAANKGKKKRA
ncbi:MAG: choice-of-anchor I family protein [Acutalibacteraceae bacterium]